jgi:hypothetical protein
MLSDALFSLASLALLLGCAGAPSSPPDERLATPAPLPDAEAELEERTRAAILAHRPRLRQCYEDALARSPDAEGRVVLVVDVGQNGKASRVLEARREGLGDDVVKCLARVLKTVAFHDGAARTVRIQVPFAFSKHGD